MALEVKDMSLMRGHLANTVVKPLGVAATMTIGATVTATSTPFDLRAATATAQKFTWAKFGFIGIKTGTAGVGGATLTVTTGATNAAAGALTNFPVTTVGTDANHGYSPASTTVVAVTKDIDLLDSQVLEWLKATVTVTGTASDTTAGYFFVILGGARELPVSNAAVATTL